MYIKNESAIKFYEKNNFIIISENIDKNTNGLEKIRDKLQQVNQNTLLLHK